MKNDKENAMKKLLHHADESPRQMRASFITQNLSLVAELWLLNLIQNTLKIHIITFCKNNPHHSIIKCLLFRILKIVSCLINKNFASNSHNARCDEGLWEGSGNI